jgi:hypothetical protein
MMVQRIDVRVCVRVGAEREISGRCGYDVQQQQQQDERTNRDSGVYQKQGVGHLDEIFDNEVVDVGRAHVGAVGYDRQPFLTVVSATSSLVSESSDHHRQCNVHTTYVPRVRPTTLSADCFFRGD